MNSTINLPFVRLGLDGATLKHRQFFDRQFYGLDNDDAVKPDPVITINLKFRPPAVGGEAVADSVGIQLEKTTRLYRHRMFIADTKSAWAELPLGRLGSRPRRVELEVDPEFDLYTLTTLVLEPLIAVILSAHGVAMVHASALARHGQAVVYPAWRHTGKTQRVLELTRQGYALMADDYCFIRGQEVVSYPKVLNLFSYNLSENPWLYNYLSPIQTSRIKTARHVTSSLYKAGGTTLGTINKVITRLAELSEIASNFSLKPKQLGIDTTTKAGLGKVVVLVAGVDQQTRRLSADQLATMSTQVIRYEHTAWWSWYRMYRFYRPDFSNPCLDKFSQRYHGLLSNITAPIVRRTVTR